MATPAEGDRALTGPAIGGLLTDTCTYIARRWGIGALTAITTTDNPRMVAVFEKRGFRVVNDLATSLVEVSKDLV